MVSDLVQSSFLKGCTATLIVIVTVSRVMGASLLTTAFLLTLGAAPWILMLLLPRRALSPSVAEIIYAVRTNDGRR